MHDLVWSPTVNGDGDESTHRWAVLLHLHALDDAFVTLDGRALCSRDTSLLRSEIQRPSGPRGVG